jgi:hypothetical protein
MERRPVSRTEYGYRTLDGDYWQAWMSGEEVKRVCRLYSLTMIARDISETRVVDLA